MLETRTTTTLLAIAVHEPEYLDFCSDRHRKEIRKMLFIENIPVETFDIWSQIFDYKKDRSMQGVVQLVADGIKSLVKTILTKYDSFETAVCFIISHEIIKTKS
ncbi:MAG: hypothetical protein PHI70_09525 [Proteiniphilum sp.]|jgi:hypothetical protein|nr:hypothetical protein [Proteiniphilum sp.]MDD4417006.1 hypothetical protein [Proteiniphilum sp.]